MQQTLQAQRQKEFGGWREQWRQDKFAHVELRRDYLGEARDQRVLAPFRAQRQRVHGRARFAALANALEWFVLAKFEQRVEARRQRRVVEQIAAKDAKQARLSHERRQREKHEMALRTLPAPAVGRTLAANAKVAVAARKHVVVTRLARERTRDREFRPRPQQRKIIEVRGDMRLCILAQEPLEIQRLAPLVIDRLAVVFERGDGCGGLVRKRDRVETIQ